MPTPAPAPRSRGPARARASAAALSLALLASGSAAALGLGLGSAPAPALAHDFAVCKKTSDRLGVKSVAFLPDPPQAGHALRVSVAGTSQTDLAGGKVQVDVKVYGITVASQSLDACSVFACPVAAGADFSAVVEQEIPAETPDKLTATVRVSVVSSAGETVSCLESQVAVADKRDVAAEGALGATHWGLARDEIEFLFRRWVAQWGKEREHAGAPSERVLGVFRDNVIRVASHNADRAQTYTMALNKFADLTSDEFAKLYLSGLKRGIKPAHAPLPELVTLRGSVAQADPPQEIDWVAKGAVNPIVDQGACGSCWAFSATAALEGAVFVKTGKLVKLSEQELVSCDGDGVHGGGDYGCQGGLMDSAWDWISHSTTAGVCSETDYPYQSGITSARGACRMDECTPVEGTKPVGFVDVPRGEAPLLAALAEHGPIAVAIEADQAAFQFYHSGVLNGACSTNFNHGVVVVASGVDEATGMKYWGVRNSWGPNWGEHGYVRIQRGKRWPASECGIELRASYPVLG